MRQGWSAVASLLGLGFFVIAGAGWAAPPSVTITYPTTGLGFVQGNAIWFGGDARDETHASLPDAALSWSSDRDGVFGTGRSLSYSGLSTGGHTLTLSAVGADGQTATAQTRIVVWDPDHLPAPAVRILAPASGTVTDAGAPLRLAGASFDYRGQALAGSALVWSADTGACLGSSSPLTVTTLPTGARVITLSATDTSGRTGTATVALTVRLVEPLTVAIDAPVVGPFYATVPIVLVGHTSGGPNPGQSDATLVWSDDREGTLGSGASLSVTLTASGPHVLTLAAQTPTGATTSVTRVLELLDSGLIPPPSVSIVEPGPDTVYFETTPVVFHGTAHDLADGELTGASLTWRSALEGPLGEGQFLSMPSLPVGTTIVFLTASTRRGSCSTASVTVVVRPFVEVPAPSVSITAPAPGSVFYETMPIEFVGAAQDALDGQLTGASLSWRSALGDPLGTGPSLSVASLPAGTCVVCLTASTERGASSTACVTILVRPSNEIPPPTVWIWSPAGDGTYYETLPVWFAAGALSTKDGSIWPPNTAWESSLDGELGTQTSFQTSSLTTGVHRLTFRAVDSLGHAGSTTREILIRPIQELPPPQVVIHQPQAGSQTYKTVQLTLAGSATDLKDGQLAGSALAWSSDLNGPLGVGSSLTTTVLTAGLHVLELTATDSLGKSASSTLSLLVRPAVEMPLPTVTIQGPGDGSTWYETVPITFQATALDLADGPLPPERVSWFSSIDGLLRDAASFSSTDLSTGLHLIEVVATSSRGTTATATVAVTVRPLSSAPPPGVTITSPQSGSRHRVGRAISLQGSATDVIDGAFADSRLAWSLEGGGQLATGGHATYMTIVPGTYCVRLTATTVRGVTTSTTAALIVEDPSPFDRPSVAITAPASGTIVGFGDAVELRGDARDPIDGNLWASLLWTSDRQGILGGGNPVSVRLTEPGTHRVCLWATNAAGGTGFAEISLHVGLPRPAVSIGWPQPGQRAYVDEPLSLQAQVSDPYDGQLPAASIQWTASAQGVVAHGVSTSAMLTLTGPTVLTATATNSFGVTSFATTAVELLEPPPSQVFVWSPSTGTTVQAGRLVDFYGAAWEPRRGWISSPPLCWESDRQGPLGCGPTPVATWLVTGVHEISASLTNSRGRTSTATALVTVLDSSEVPGPAVTVWAPVPAGTFYATVPIELRGSGVDALNGAMSGPALRWTNEGGGLLATGQTATATFTEGQHTVFLEAVDTRGLRASTSVTFQVLPESELPPPVVGIERPIATALYYDTVPVEFVGHASDLADGSLTGEQLTWTTTRGQLLGIGQTPPATVLPVGVWTIRLTGTNSHQRSSSATVTLEILPLSAAPPPQVTILSPWPGQPAPVGQGLGCSATAVDVIEGALTPERFTWSSEAFAAPVTGSNVTIPITAPLGPYEFEVRATTSRGATSVASGRLVVVDPSATTPPRVEIVTPLEGATFFYGSVVYGQATAMSDSDGELDWPRFQWLGPAGQVLSSRSSLAWAPTTVASSFVLRVVATDSAGRTGEATREIAILPPVPQPWIRWPSSGQRVWAGDRLDLSGTGWDPLDGEYPSSQLAWLLEPAGVTASGANTFVSTLPIGEYHVVLVATNSQGVTARVSVPIEVVSAPPPGLQVMSPMVDASFCTGQPMPLWAWTSDPLDWALPGDTLEWSSDRQGTLGRGNMFNVNAPLAPGPLVICVRGTNSHGVTGVATRAVTIVADPNLPPPVVSIDQPAGTYFSGLPVFLTGVGIDTFGQAVTGENLVWSGFEGVALGSGSTLETTLPAGTHAITLTGTDVRGKSGVACVTLQVSDSASAPPPSVHLTRPSSQNTCYASVPFALEGWAEDPIDGLLTGSALSWSTTSGLQLGVGVSPGVTALAEGVWGIQLTATDSRGKSATETVTIQVLSLDAAPAPRVTLHSPFPGQLATVGTTLTLAASAVDVADGSLADGCFSWSSEAFSSPVTGNALEVPVAGPTGIHPVVVTGRASRGATGMASTALIVVDPEATTPPRVTLLSPTAGFVGCYGVPVQLAAEGFSDSDGPLAAGRFEWLDAGGQHLASGSQATWLPTTVASEFVLRVVARDSAGRASEVTCAVEILPPIPHVAILEPFSGQVFKTGEVVLLHGEASDLLDGELGSGAVNWTSSRDGLIACTVSAATTALSTGHHLLALSATSSLGVSATATVAIEIVPPIPPTIALLQPVPGGLYYTGLPVPFVVAVPDSGDGEVAPEGVRWLSSLSGSIGSGGAFECTTLPAGIHTICVTVTNSRGASASATVALELRDPTILPPPLVELAQPDDAGVYYATVPVTLAGSAFDALGRKVAPDALAWSSSLDGSLGTGSQLSALLSTGSHLIALAGTDWRGRAGSASVAIDVRDAGSIPPPNVRIVQPAPDASFYETVRIVFEGAGTDLVDGELPDEALSWSLEDGTLLGTGRSLETTIPPGLQTIHLTGSTPRGLSSTAVVGVSIQPLSEAPPPVIVLVSPGAGQTVQRGQPFDLTAQASDLLEGVLPGSQLVWTSPAFSQPITGTSRQISLTRPPGVYPIFVQAANSRGVTAAASTAIVLVEPSSAAPPRVDILSPLTGQQVRLGAALELKAKAFSESEGVVQPGNIQWWNGDGQLLGYGSPFPWTASPLGPGLVLRAVVSDSQGRMGEVTVAVNVTPPVPVVSIVRPSDGWTVLPGDAVSLLASAGDGAGGWLDGGAVHWQADWLGELGTGASLSTTVPMGLHVVTVTAANTFGLTTSASVTIHATTPAPVLRIVAPASDERVDFYLPVEFRGEAWLPLSEPEPVPPEALSWTLDTTQPLGVGPSVVATNLTTGPHRVTFASNGVHGTTVVTSVDFVVHPNVNDACNTGDPQDRRPLRIQVHHPAPCHSRISVYEGTPVFLQAVATDVSEGELPAWATSWSSSVEGTIGAGRLVQTTDLMTGTHILTVSAQNSWGLTACTTVAVEVLPVPPPIVNIIWPQAGSLPPTLPGQPLTLQAQVSTQANAGPYSQHLRWLLDGILLATGFSATVSAPSPGVHTLQAQYQDPGRAAGLADVTIQIEDPTQFAPRILSAFRLVPSTWPVVPSPLGVVSALNSIQVWPAPDASGPRPLYGSDLGVAWILTNTANRPVQAAVSLTSFVTNTGCSLWATLGVVTAADRRRLLWESLTPGQRSTASIAFTLPATQEAMALVLVRDTAVGWEAVTDVSAVHLQLYSENGPTERSSVVLPMFPREPSQPAVTIHPTVPILYGSRGTTVMLTASATDIVDGVVPWARHGWFRQQSDGTWDSLARGPVLTATYASGQVLIRAVATNTAGTTGTTAVVVTGFTPPVMSIRIEPAVTCVFAGEQAQAQAVCHWPSPPVVPITMNWRSNTQGVLAQGETLDLSLLTVGRHDLTLLATAPDGTTTSSHTGIEVLVPPSIESVGIVDVTSGLTDLTDSPLSGLSTTDAAIEFLVSKPSGESASLGIRLVWDSPLSHVNACLYASNGTTPLWSSELQVAPSGNVLIPLPATLAYVRVRLTLPREIVQSVAVGVLSLQTTLAGNGGALRRPAHVLTLVAGLSRPNGKEDDWDGDGVTNVDERMRGLNPYDVDTDGDGPSDLVEISMDTSPNDPDSNDDLRRDGVAPADPANVLLKDGLAGTARVMQENGSSTILQWDMPSRTWQVQHSGWGGMEEFRPVAVVGPTGYYDENGVSWSAHASTTTLHTETQCTLQGPRCTRWLVTSEGVLPPAIRPGSSRPVLGSMLSGISHCPDGLPIEAPGMGVWVRDYFWDVTYACRDAELTYCRCVGCSRTSGIGIGSSGHGIFSIRHWPLDGNGPARLRDVVASSVVGWATSPIDVDGPGFVVRLENRYDERNPVRIRLGSSDGPIGGLVRDTAQGNAPLEYLGMCGLSPTEHVDAIVHPVPNGMCQFYFPLAGQEGTVGVSLEVKTHDGMWHELGRRTVQLARFNCIVDVERVPVSRTAGPLPGSEYPVVDGVAGPIGPDAGGFAVRFGHMPVRDVPIAAVPVWSDLSGNATSPVPGSLPNTLSATLSAFTSVGVFEFGPDWLGDFETARVQMYYDGVPVRFADAQQVPPLAATGSGSAAPQPAQPKGEVEFGRMSIVDIQCKRAPIPPDATSRTVSILQPGPENISGNVFSDDQQLLVTLKSASALPTTATLALWCEDCPRTPGTSETVDKWLSTTSGGDFLQTTRGLTYCQTKSLEANGLTTFTIGRSHTAVAEQHVRLFGVGQLKGTTVAEMVPPRRVRFVPRPNFMRIEGGNVQVREAYRAFSPLSLGVYHLRSQDILQTQPQDLIPIPGAKVTFKAGRAYEVLALRKPGVASTQEEITTATGSDGIASVEGESVDQVSLTGTETTSEVVRASAVSAWLVDNDGVTRLPALRSNEREHLTTYSSPSEATTARSMLQMDAGNWAPMPPDTVLFNLAVFRNHRLQPLTIHIHVTSAAVSAIQTINCYAVTSEDASTPSTYVVISPGFVDSLLDAGAVSEEMERRLQSLFTGRPVSFSTLLEDAPASGQRCSALTTGPNGWVVHVVSVRPESPDRTHYSGIDVRGAMARGEPRFDEDPNNRNPNAYNASSAVPCGGYSAIVYMEQFAHFPPADSWSGTTLGRALGNVVGHELGHNLGLVAPQLFGDDEYHPSSRSDGVGESPLRFDVMGGYDPSRWAGQAIRFDGLHGEYLKEMMPWP